MSTSVYLRVGNGEEHEVGAVEVPADGQGSDACSAVAGLLREVAAEMDRQNAPRTLLDSILDEFFPGPETKENDR